MLRHRCTIRASVGFLFQRAPTLQAKEIVPTKSLQFWIAKPSSSYALRSLISILCTANWRSGQTIVEKFSKTNLTTGRSRSCDCYIFGWGRSGRLTGRGGSFRAKPIVRRAMHASSVKVRIEEGEAKPFCLAASSRWTEDIWVRSRSTTKKKSCPALLQLGYSRMMMAASGNSRDRIDAGWDHAGWWRLS